MRGRRQTPIEGGIIITETKFLWLPVSIGNEYRWFEKATIKYKSHRMWDVTCGAEWVEWRPIEFVDK